MSYIPLYEQLVTGKTLVVPKKGINKQSFRTGFYRYRNSTEVTKLMAKNKVINIMSVDDNYEIKLIKQVKSKIQYEIKEETISRSLGNN